MDVKKSKHIIILLLPILISCGNNKQGLECDSQFYKEMLKERCVFDNRLCLRIPKNWNLVKNEVRNNVVYSDTMLNKYEVLITSIAEFPNKDGISLNKFFNKNINRIKDDGNLDVKETGHQGIGGNDGRYVIIYNHEIEKNPFYTFSIYLERANYFYIIDLSYFGSNLDKSKFCKGKTLIDRHSWEKEG